MSSEARHKGTVWCEHNMNIKFCLACKEKEEKKAEAKEKKSKASKGDPVSA